MNVYKKLLPHVFFRILMGMGRMATIPLDRGLDMGDARRRMQPLIQIVALAAVTVVSACSTAGSIDNPVSRKLTWFSYLNGDDVRAACRAGAGDRLRLVYNADWEEQVRVYNLSAEGGAPILEEQILTPLTFGGGGGRTLMDAISGEKHSTAIGTTGAGEIWQAVLRSGALEPTPKGTDLLSDHHYWVAVGCYQGAVFFNAWQYPKPHWDRVLFVDAVRRHEASRMPWPKISPNHFDHRTESDRFQRYPVFRMTVGEHGFRYLP